MYIQYWREAFFVTLSFIFFPVCADELKKNPCDGPYALLALTDRPSVADSACVVPYGNALLEMGYQYQKLLGKGYQQNLPEAELRIGLPANNELVLLLPNYIHQSVRPHSGFSASTIGLKHEIGYNSKWITAVEALITLPTGSAEFGNQGAGGAVNGIVSYNMNAAFNVTFMLGLSNQTLSKQASGGRYTSINPDIVLTWSKDPLDVYIELYGQSKTSPQETNGFNLDTGIIYLVMKNLALDIEIGQRLKGNLNAFNHYMGTGVSLFF